MALYQPRGFHLSARLVGAVFRFQSAAAVNKTRLAVVRGWRFNASLSGPARRIPAKERAKLVELGKSDTIVPFAKGTGKKAAEKPWGAELGAVVG